MKWAKFAAWLIAGSAISSAACLAASEPVFESDNWTVYKRDDGEGCYTIRMGEHEKFGTLYFRVEYLPKDKMVLLTTSSEVTTSLDESGHVDAQMIFLYSQDNEYDDGWPERRFDYRKVDSEESHIFMTSFEGSQNVEQILTDIASSKGMILEHNELAFSAALLDGSAQAIAETRECSLKAAGINPLDPFAQ